MFFLCQKNIVVSLISVIICHDLNDTRKFTVVVPQFQLQESDDTAKFDPTET